MQLLRKVSFYLSVKLYSNVTLGVHDLYDLYHISLINKNIGPETSLNCLPTL